MKVIKAEMTGTVLEWKVKVGDSIKKGQEVAILESMKMEVSVKTPHDGKVTRLVKAVGDFLNEGDAFLEIE
jgi:acetyl-CoA carboxylase biotin carboxyl carrier protein